VFGASPAQAEELVMPYSCNVASGDVRLTPGQPVRYALGGERNELPFSVCSKGEASACITMMVHRFTLACGGEAVAWARVAEAARGLGLPVPADLPPGYAPVGMVQGRFVFPALAKFGPHDGGVSSEVLSADSVEERPDDQASMSESAGQSWQTVIKAEYRPDAPAGALKIGGIVASLMAFLLAASMVAAGRWPVPAVAFKFDKVVSRARRKLLAWGEGKHRNRAEAGAGETLLNALAIATARLAETELLIATLPRDLLLREVLQSETNQIRARLDTLARDGGKRPPEKSATGVRALLRDLERISRIAHGAIEDGGKDAGAARHRQDVRMPASVQEAYRLLGLNADVAPGVAKKLVDALRMSWHPDFARDEDDRQLREARMKQINAAWELIKDRRQAA
jgi:hypothetical protein